MGPCGMKWWMYYASRYVHWIPPSFLRWFWRRDPGAQTHLTSEKQFEMLRKIATDAKPHEREAGLFTTDESVRLWLRTSREAFKNGVDAVVQGSMLLGSDWHFRIQDIRPDLPVWLWYGRFDDIAPIGHGEEIAARLGKNVRFNALDETHGSMFANQPRTYLAEVVKYMNQQAGAVV